MALEVGQEARARRPRRIRRRRRARPSPTGPRRRPPRRSSGRSDPNARRPSGAAAPRAASRRWWRGCRRCSRFYSFLGAPPMRAIRPPSTRTTSPVMNDAPADSRKATTSAISSGAGRGARAGAWRRSRVPDGSRVRGRGRRRRAASAYRPSRARRRSRGRRIRRRVDRHGRHEADQPVLGRRIGERRRSAPPCPAPRPCGRPRPSLAEQRHRACERGSAPLRLTAMTSSQSASEVVSTVP